MDVIAFENKKQICFNIFFFFINYYGIRFNIVYDIVVFIRNER